MKLSLRELRGLGIVAAGGQIQRISDTKFIVKSQNNDKDYRVEWINKWVCNCQDYIKREKPCKHIFAVNFLLNLPMILLLNYKAFERKCPYCGSSRTILRGFRYNKSGAVRLRKCKDCNKWFKDAAFMERKEKGNNTLFAVISLDLFYKGLSLRGIRDHLKQIYNVDKSVSTIHRWVLKLTSLLREASQKLKVYVGDTWLADETIIKINGKEKYLWNILDYKTRFHIVSLVMEYRGAKEAIKVLVEAVRRSGKIPNELVTDGLKSYDAALKMLNLPVKHIRNVSIANKANNNNRIERLHGTLKSWIKNKRGLKNHAEEMIEAYRIYYNYIRPHIGLENASPINEHEGKWLQLLIKAKRQR